MMPMPQIADGGVCTKKDCPHYRAEASKLCRDCAAGEKSEEKPAVPDFKKMLLTRHAADETICVSGYKKINGKFVVSERFCDGVDQALDEERSRRMARFQDLGLVERTEPTQEPS